MRRAVLVLGGTAACLAALFSFKAHSVAAATPAPSTPATPAAASPAATHPAAPAATRTITGPVAMTKYGPMQIKITMVGQQITRVTLLQRTGRGTQTQRIATFAIPKLAG